MPQSPTLDVGMDVHKDSMAVASVAQDHGAEVVVLGSIGTRQGDSEPLSRTMHSTATRLVFVYEAGPGGDGLDRDLTKTGHLCGVVAPSLTPKKAGDRGTPDRRDARPVARLRRSGARTPISIPAGEAEALRELSRAREEAIRALRAAKVRLTAFLLRHNRRYAGRATGGPAPLRWLSEVICATPAQPIVCQAYGRAATDHTDRLGRLEHAPHEQTNTWRRLPVGEAVQALRGVQFPIAVTIVAELGDLTRFEHPSQLRSAVGVMPSDYSSGARRHRSGITKAGNRHARRVLIEGAWAYRYPAQVSRHLQRRLGQRPKSSQAISGQAPVRRCKRDRILTARGTHANLGVVAIARELLACRGAIAQAGPRPA